MKPYLIKGQLIYITEIEHLRDYVEEDVWEAINDLFKTQITKYETISTLNQELENDIEDYQKHLYQLSNDISTYMLEIEQLQRLNKKGILSRFEKLKNHIDEVLT